MLSNAQTEKLAALVMDLLENDEQFRAALPLEPVAKEMLRSGIGLVELMEVVARGYADRPALGARATELVTTDGRAHRRALPRYETISYRELWARVTGVGAALFERPVRPGDRVATLGAPSIDYVTVDMAIGRLDGVSVPLHASTQPRRLQPIVDDTEPSMLACGVDHLGTAVELCLASPSILRLLVLDHHRDVDDDREALDAARTRLEKEGGQVVAETVAEALERGRNLAAPPMPTARPERLAAIIYTSGSSGNPKGAMHPERLVADAFAFVAAAFINRGFAVAALTLNYLPLSHTGGRAMLYSTLGAGGTAYFPGSNDLSTMIEDLALVRPTQLNFVPRVWELLHTEFTARSARNEGTRDEILATIRNDVLGGRYISALTGSAPISEGLAAWVEELIDTHLINALGATESGSVIIDGRLPRPPITDYRLDDVPELGYFSTDRPHPRGELLIKSTGLFAGYYRRDDLTRAVFDDDGFYRTGDVVAQLGPDEVQFLDRRNNVVKLSQGEFVTISKLETLFEECEPVGQVYVYGNSERAYLLAVVVPTVAATDEYGPSVAEAVMRSFQDAAARNALEPYETPRDVIIESSPFTLENGLLTGPGKLARRELKERYGARLDARYAEHAQKQTDRWNVLLERVSHQSVLESVCEAAAVELGDHPVAPAPDDRYTDLGGDSLSAVSFASMLSDLFGVEVDVGVVISPAHDLRAVAISIEALRGRDIVRPTFASVHGAAATSVAADDLELERFLDDATLAGVPSLAPPTSEPRNVLLTGATGYLGRYLALEWLDRMTREGGTVTCLVRAADDASARARLDTVFDRGDEVLVDRYRALADGRLVVLAADKAELALGLDADTWQRLAREVDLIVDPAALVNHMLPYPQLFGPNVVGTAELIRLALTTRQKPIIHVSSAAVGLGITPGTFTEDADIRTMCPSRAIGHSYASGYATSKWAGEVLLREAHERCGLPVRIFRCDMLMAETTYRGQLNVSDMVTRLLFSVAATRLAPASFYTRAVDGGRARAHFDGLPVDFVADAISTIGVDLAPDLRTYHAVNPHDDGIGLDQYVDWMAQAGNPIERIDDHDEWFRRFESSLRNLPERQRRASLLPIIEAYRYAQPPTPGSFAPTDRFERAVAEHGLGGGRIPGIGRETIEKYVADLEYLGYL